jgi:hypothetical protein
MIVALLLKYWKPIAAFSLVFSLLFGAYCKGRSDANKSWEARNARELESRYAEWEKTRQANDEIVNKIHKRRQSVQDDTYDTCIMSNNPMEDTCK